MDISARVLELAAGHNLHSGSSDNDRLPDALEYADRQWEQMVNAWCSRMFASAPARTFDLSSSSSTAQSSTGSQRVRNSCMRNDRAQDQSHGARTGAALPASGHEDNRNAAHGYAISHGQGSSADGADGGVSGGRAGLARGGACAAGSAACSGARAADRAAGASDVGAAAAADVAHQEHMAIISELAFSQEVKVVLGLQVLLDKDEGKAGQRAELAETAHNAARLMRVLPLDTSSGMRLIARTMSLGMLFYAGGKSSDYGIYLRARGPEIDAALDAALKSARGAVHSPSCSGNEGVGDGTAGGSAADGAGSGGGCTNGGSTASGGGGAGGGSGEAAAQAMSVARFELLCEIFAVWREMFSFSEKLDQSYLQSSHRSFNEHLKAAADLTEHCSDEQLRLAHALYLKVLARCRAATCALLDMEDSDCHQPAGPADNEIDWDAVGNAFEEDAGAWGPADMQHSAIAPGGDRELACSEFSEALSSVNRLEDHELEVTIRALRTMVKLA